MSNLARTIFSQPKCEVDKSVPLDQIRTPKVGYWSVCADRLRKQKDSASLNGNHDGIDCSENSS